MLFYVRNFCRQASAPSMVMDKANFPASVQLRALLSSPNAEQNQPFFDVL